MIDFAIVFVIVLLWATLLFLLEGVTSPLGKVAFTVVAFPIAPFWLLIYFASRFVDGRPSYKECPTCGQRSLLRAGRVRANPPLPLLAVCFECKSRFEQSRGGQLLRVHGTKYDRWFRDALTEHQDRLTTTKAGG